jgi:predicted Zn-dependent peptidase
MLQRHPRILAFAMAFALTLAASPAVLADPVLPKGVVAGPSIEAISEYTLANGLRVLLFPDASKPTVTVNVTYGVGSAQENYGETGMAHLLEHLVFKGTPTHTDISGEMKKRGISFNATTSLDRTNYVASGIGAGGESLRDPGLLSVVAVVPKDGDAAKAEAELITQVEQLATRGRDMGFTASLDAQFEALTLEQVNAAIRKHLKPEALSVYIAGDFAAAAKAEAAGAN